MQATQKGVALAILLWFIAALSLLAAGIMLTAKVDMRYASLQSAMARATAAGDGAIQLYIHDLSRGGLDANSSLEEDALAAMPVIYNIGPYRVYVRVVPAAGLINIITADEVLLTNLLRLVGGLESREAEILAQSVLQWRLVKPPDPQRTVQMSEPLVRVLEDVMKVPGMTRDVFDKISPLIYAKVVAELGNVNISAAPFDVLVILADGSLSQAEALRAEFPVVATTPSGLVRIDARTDVGFGLIYQRSSWVDLGASLVPSFGQNVGMQGSKIKRRNTVTAVSSIDFNELAYVSQ